MSEWTHPDARPRPPATEGQVGLRRLGAGVVDIALVLALAAILPGAAVTVAAPWALYRIATLLAFDGRSNGKAGFGVQVAGLGTGRRRLARAVLREGTLPALFIVPFVLVADANLEVQVGTVLLVLGVVPYLVLCDAVMMLRSNGHRRSLRDRLAGTYVVRHGMQS